MMKAKFKNVRFLNQFFLVKYSFLSEPHYSMIPIAHPRSVSETKNLSIWSTVRFLWVKKLNTKP